MTSVAQARLNSRIPQTPLVARRTSCNGVRRRRTSAGIRVKRLPQDCRSCKVNTHCGVLPQFPGGARRKGRAVLIVLSSVDKDRRSFRMVCFISQMRPRSL